MRTLTMLLFLMLAMGAAPAAPPIDPDTASAEESADLTATDQSVDVSPQTSDRAIARRLQAILEATEEKTDRFARPTVEVDEGIVTITGIARSAEDKEWATQLARKTDDVVAVINTMTLREMPLWTMEPAIAEIKTLWSLGVRALPLVVLGLVVLFITIFFARTLARLFARPLAQRLESRLLASVLERLLFLLVVIVGVYLFLRISGLTKLAVTLAGGTGLVGLALGFAFRDIAENFLASILISIQRPFRIGDTIKVDGHKGVVQRVTTRGTILMDFDGNHIQIANATVYKNTIENFTANPKIRAKFSIGIGYDASISRAQQIALDLLEAHSAVLDDPKQLILVSELGASSVVLTLYFWVDGSQYSMGKVRSAVMRKIVQAYDDAGISMPDDAREVIFPDGVPVRMLEDGESLEESDPSPTPPITHAERRADGSDATEAEGDLQSEVHDIQKQAEASRSPEDGKDIMEDDDSDGDSEQTNADNAADSNGTAATMSARN